MSKLNKALVGFNTPESMTIGQRLEIRAILTHELSHEELTGLVRGSAPSEGVTISELRASDLMTASLSSDDGIAIEPAGPQKQWVSATEPTEWHWQITAHREGEHRLVVEFFALLNIAGDTNPRHIRTLSKTIVVHVGPTLIGRLSVSIATPLGFAAIVGFLVFVSATVYVAFSGVRVFDRLQIPVWFPTHASRLLDPKSLIPENIDGFISSANAETRSTDFIRWAGAERVTLAIVFTDIVNSTAIGEAVKDERMNEIRRAHFTRSRKLITEFDGREIKTIGDSFMTAFRNAADAL